MSRDHEPVKRFSLFAVHKAPQSYARAYLSYRRAFSPSSPPDTLRPNQIARTEEKDDAAAGGFLYAIESQSASGRYDRHEWVATASSSGGPRKSNGSELSLAPFAVGIKGILRR